MSAADGLLMTLLFWGGLTASFWLGRLCARWMQISDCKHDWLNISPEISDGAHASICTRCHHTSQKPMERIP
jgi:hypothetical protein